MLETIPIVKFGDNDESVEAAKRDVEMTMNSEEARREYSPPRSDSITPVEMSAPGELRASTPEQPSDRSQTTARESKTDVAPDGGNFSCPICTDDFIKGQDLRVLPCNHQFHMECIDPWLVNVSGTCPLWFVPPDLPSIYYFKPILMQSPSAALTLTRPKPKRMPSKEKARLVRTPTRRPPPIVPQLRPTMQRTITRIDGSRRSCIATAL